LNHPSDNPEHYKKLVSNLATKINQRMDRDLDSKSSGLIINTSGWIENSGFDIILHCAKAFSVDIILVMSQDKLYSNLATLLNSNNTNSGVNVVNISNNMTNGNINNVTVVKLPRSGGVVTRVLD
jgi:polyribonucleotide 5'-hydroxyl-kinase